LAIEVPEATAKPSIDEVIAFSSTPASLNLSPKQKVKKEDAQSRLSQNLLQNLTLSIVLLKNIAIKFAHPDLFEAEVAKSISKITESEKILNQFEMAGVNFNETGEEVKPQKVQTISYLVRQHKEEILDKSESLKDAMSSTMSPQFTNMLQICIFVPFLHPETPKPQSIPKDKQIKDDEMIHAELIARVLNFRNNYTKTLRQPSVPVVEVAMPEMPEVKIKPKTVKEEPIVSNVVTKRTMTVYKPGPSVKRARPKKAQSVVADSKTGTQFSSHDKSIQ
jgi:hypothetical protein